MGAARLQRAEQGEGVLEPRHQCQEHRTVSHGHNGTAKSLLSCLPLPVHKHHVELGATASWLPRPGSCRCRGAQCAGARAQGPTAMDSQAVRPAAPSRGQVTRPAPVQPAPPAHPVWLRVEEPAHDESGGHDAEQDRPHDFLPPVQEEHRVLSADILGVAGAVQEPDGDLRAPPAPLPLVVGQVIPVVFKASIEGLLEFKMNPTSRLSQTIHCPQHQFL